MSDLSQVKELDYVGSHHDANKLLATGKWMLIFAGLNVETTESYERDSVDPEKVNFLGMHTETYPVYILGRIK